MRVCVQVHGSGDARHVQHQPSLQEESFCDDCHRVGPGLRRLLSPAVRFQHHRSGHCILFSSSCQREFNSCAITYKSKVMQNRMQVHILSSYGLGSTVGHEM